jgi:hypothetical protein
MRPFGSRAEMRIGAPDARAATCVRGLREWMAGMLKASRSSVGGVEGLLAMPAGDSDTSACLSPIGVSGACLRKGLSACAARRGLRLRSDCSTLLQRYSPCTKLANGVALRVNQSHSEPLRATQQLPAQSWPWGSCSVARKCWRRLVIDWSSSSLATRTDVSMLHASAAMKLAQLLRSTSQTPKLQVLARAVHVKQSQAADVRPQVHPLSAWSPQEDIQLARRPPRSASPSS